MDCVIAVVRDAENNATSHHSDWHIDLFVCSVFGAMNQFLNHDGACFAFANLLQNLLCVLVSGT